MKARAKAGLIVAAFAGFAATSHSSVLKHPGELLDSVKSMTASAGSSASVTTSGSMTYGPLVTDAYQMARSYGWHKTQDRCLNWLWTRESGWRMVWNYQGSGAFGIAQALPPSKMASAGADYMTNPVTDIRWGLSYIASTYTDPCGAWAHEQADSWY